MIIGIDPGKSGGVALVNMSGEVKFISPFDNSNCVSALSEALSLGCQRVGKVVVPAKIYVENVHAMPKQGVSSTFRFGVELGRVLGVLEYAGVDWEQVPPTVWMKHYREEYGETAKERVLSWLDGEYGLDMIRLVGKRGKPLKRPHGGMADALGLANWGMLKTLGKL